MHSVDGEVDTEQCNHGKDDCEEIILKSMYYQHKHQAMSDSTLTVCVPVVVNIETNFLVKPKSNIDAAQNIVAVNMYGRRLPKRDFELSAMTPFRIKVWFKCQIN